MCEADVYCGSVVWWCGAVVGVFVGSVYQYLVCKSILKKSVAVYIMVGAVP